MKSKPALLAVTMQLTAACAQAQTQAPGLWEHTFKLTSPGGETGMDMTGKWLGADCGDLKPLGALPVK